MPRWRAGTRHYYTVFGAGTVLGGLATGYLRALPLGPTTTGIVVVFGAALLPLGLGASRPVALAGFALAGLVWGPYRATSTALFQRSTSPALLPQVLAAYSVVGMLAVPLGTLAGGPLVAVLGAQRTLLLCALGTVALGAAALTVVAASVRRRAKTRGQRP